MRHMGFPDLGGSMPLFLFALAVLGSKWKQPVLSQQQIVKIDPFSQDVH